jgi:hypothetical protein
MALDSYDAYSSSTVEGVAKAESALTLTETYLVLLGESQSSVNTTLSTDVPPPEAPIISLEYAQSLVEEAAREKNLADADKRDQTLTASKSAAQGELVVLEGVAKIAKEGTDKMVGVSFVTKEGASAVYDFGEIMLNVIEDIVDNGTFDTGKQSGTSGKYPDWSYSYDLNIDEKDLSFVFENTADGQKVELLGTVTSGFKESTIVFTWSGNLITESGQKLVMPNNAESLEQCVFFADGDSQFTNNASCLYIDLNKDIAVNNPDYSDLEVLKVSSFNVVEFIDGQYGFDGTVKFDIYGLDSDGQPKGLFSSGDVIEHADFVVEGITEQTEFSAVFDVKYDDIHKDIGTFDVNLLNFNGYQFRLDLVSEVGPIVGEVSIYNDVEGKKAVAGAIREITNGFNIIYVDSQSIDYTDIDFLGKSN